MAHVTENNLETVKMLLTRHYLPAGATLVGFRVFEKREEEKRSKWDNSKHLLVFFVDLKGELGKIQASHNNNQHLKIHRYSYWFHDDHKSLASVEPKRGQNFEHWKNYGT